MTSILDMSGSSDSEDDIDYVPPTENGAASDSSCDEVVSDEEAEFNVKGKLKPEVTKKQGPDKTESDPKTAKDEKQRANELWLNFLNDVEESASIKTNHAVCKSNDASVISSVESDRKPSKIDAKPASKTLIFSEETDTSNTQTHLVGKDRNSSATVKDNSQEMQSSKKRGIDSVLGTLLNKNKKLTVLDKSKLDWDEFKKGQGLENELEKINKGKAGFLEKKRFLERSDLRSFELEKSMRETLRKK